MVQQIIKAELFAGYSERINRRINMKENQEFDISNIQIIEKKENGKLLTYMGEPVKTLRYLKDIKTDGYRVIGLACDKENENRKYLIKYIYQPEFQKAIRDGSVNPRKLEEDKERMQKERKVADFLRDKQKSVYLTPPQYLFDISEINAKGKKIKKVVGSVYPYRGKDWEATLGICDAFMNQEKKMIFKENVILQLFYAVQMLHSLNGNFVHRDIKPANILIEPLDADYEEYIVSLGDWDWAVIGQNTKDYFKSVLGGTRCFAHPNAFHQDTCRPYKGWDYYSLGLTMYYILEDESFLNDHDQYWNEPEIAFDEMSFDNTKKYLEHTMGSEEANTCVQLLRKISHKLMGKDQTYKNQYEEIQTAIEDYEEYLGLRYKHRYDELVNTPYHLYNSDQRYSRGNRFQIRCRYMENDNMQETHYMLADRDAMTIEAAGEKIAILYTTGNPHAILLHNDWMWSGCNEDLRACRLKEQDNIVVSKDGKFKITISYKRI